MVGLADKFNTLKEGNYASMKKEPLGKSMYRGYEWPDSRKDGVLPFGKETNVSAPAKEILYAHGGSYEEK